MRGTCSGSGIFRLIVGWTSINFSQMVISTSEWSRTRVSLLAGVLGICQSIKVCAEYCIHRHH